MESKQAAIASSGVTPSFEQIPDLEVPALFLLLQGLVLSVLLFLLLWACYFYSYFYYYSYGYHYKYYDDYQFGWHGFSITY